MNLRRLPITLFVALLLGFPLVAAATAAVSATSSTAQTAPLAWSLEQDLRSSFEGTPTNPLPDSHGNADIWSLEAGASVEHDAAASLLANHTEAYGGFELLEAWHGVDIGARDVPYPTVGMNLGDERIIYDVLVPTGKVLVHPNAAATAIVRWRSPFTGHARVTGSFKHLDLNGGDGVVWTVDHNTTTLVTGTAYRGTSAFVAASPDGNGTVPVATGDTLAFVIGPRDGYDYDTTQLEVLIEQVVGPTQGNVLTVEKTGTGQGTVTSDPAGIDCGDDCTQEYDAGTVVTLTATAADGSSFAGWSGACSADPCQVTMDEAKSVTATFTLDVAPDPAYLVPWGAAGYRYKQVGKDALPGFEAPDYDDSAWAVGPAPFGNIDACAGLPPQTQWDAGTEEAPSNLLVRRTFTVPAGTDHVLVHIAVDNDVTVHVNGLYSSGFVAGPGGCATRDNVGPFRVDAAFLHLGAENVLAVRGNDYGAATYLDVAVTAVPESTSEPQSCVTPSTSGAATGGVQTWKLADDFAASDANPTPDSYGNAGVWHFCSSADLDHDPSGFTKLPNLTADLLGNGGQIKGWHGGAITCAASPDLPLVLINTGADASDQVCPGEGIMFPGEAVLVHPTPSRRGVVAWRSPVSGSIRIAGGVADLDHGGGDGVRWSIHKNTDQIESGAIANGESALFSVGLTASVEAGDVLYFAVHPNDSAADSHDSTKLDVTLTLGAAPPEALTITKTADAALVFPGAATGYTIELENPNAEPMTVDAISDELPAGFTYAGPTTGVTDSDPTILGQALTWGGPFTLPAEGTISLHFGVTATATPGSYFNTADAYDETGHSIATTGPTAEIVVEQGAQPCITPSTAGGATGGVQTWKLGDDFSASNDNPAPDSYGNAEVWHFCSGDESGYLRLPSFTPDVLGSGLKAWHGNEITCGASPDLPIILVNPGSTDLEACTAFYPAKAVVVHPTPSKMATVAWRSPVSGTIRISGGVADHDSRGGDGVQWFVAKGADTIATGSIAKGESELFPLGLTASVEAGDVLYFAVHSGGAGDATHDSTRLDVTLTLGAADVSISKSASADTVRVGEELRYTLTVKNETPGTTASRVIVTDVMDPLVLVEPPVVVTPAQPPGWGCVVIGSISCDLADVTGTVTIEYVVKPTEAGSLVNAAEVAAAGDPNEANDRAEVSVTVLAREFPLEVVRAGTGTGSVVSSPDGIDCADPDPDCTETYQEDTVVTLTATPDDDSEFAGWSGDCTGDSCVVTMDAAKTVTAIFTKKTHLLTVAKAGSGSGTVTGTGIACGGDCSESYPHGTVVTLIATPAAGSTFTGWSGACVALSGPCVVTMDAAKNVVATFTSNQMLLTVAKAGSGTGTVSGPGIACGGDCSESYALGTRVTLTATPAAGSVFSGWSGACTSGSSQCRVTMNASRNVVATFTRSGFLLTVLRVGSGSIVSAPAGIQCSTTSTDCSERYPEGTVVTLTATPAQGYTFARWTGPCVTPSGPLGPCQVTMAGARLVTAVFDSALLRLRVLALGQGSVTSNPPGIACSRQPSNDCVEDYPRGTVVTLTAVPAPGHEFTGWSIGCSGRSLTCTLTIDRPVEVVFATFRRRQ